jgi:cell division transport system ATP-binding protein
MIDLRNVSKTYSNGSIALKDITLHIDQGEFVLLTGRSGSGKSTLLKLLYGAEIASAGTVTVAGTDMANLTDRQLAMLRRRIGVVFQDYKLIPNRTVRENVAMVLVAQGIPRADIDRAVTPALKMVGLMHKEFCFPDQLSGGEQQRVSIARAIVNRPPLLVADEPTGNLDQENSLQVLKILEKLHSLGVTIVITSHDVLVLNNFPHRLINLHRGVVS